MSTIRSLHARFSQSSPQVIWTCWVVAAIACFKLAYFTNRQAFDELMLTLTILSIAYLILAKQTISVKKIIALGMGLRVVFLLAVPALSDDYFRYLWDGRLTWSGISPFAHLPEAFIHGNIPTPQGIDASLFERLNSPSYYSIYPPFAQLYFAWGALFSPEGTLIGGVVAMRILVLLAEWSTLWLIPKLLEKWNLPSRNIAWYAFNPLVLVEFSGNLHLEVFMIFFTLAALWLVQKGNWILGSAAYALAIVSKLLPLMFLPMFLLIIGWKKSLRFYIAVGMITIASFLPFLTPAIVEQIGSSVDLYFRRFEFNASVFYIVRWIGFQTKGWDIIQTAGPRLSMIAGLFALVMAVLPKYQWYTLPKRMLFALAIYLFLSTIVHPWYVGPLVCFSLFTTFRFPIVWSLTVPLSYAAYQSSTYQENLWWVALEYVIVFGWLLYELWTRLQNAKPSQPNEVHPI